MWWVNYSKWLNSVLKYTNPSLKKFYFMLWMYLIDVNCIHEHLYCIQFILNRLLSGEVLPKILVIYTICSQKCTLSVCVRLILTLQSCCPHVVSVAIHAKHPITFDIESLSWWWNMCEINWIYWRYAYASARELIISAFTKFMERIA